MRHRYTVRTGTVQVQRLYFDLRRNMNERIVWALERF